MKIFKKHRAIALLMVFIMLLTSARAVDEAVFAADADETLSVPEGDVTNTVLEYTDASIVNDTVTLYEYYTDGSGSTTITGVEGEILTVYECFTYSDGSVLYAFHYDYDTNADLRSARLQGYQFIWSTDISFEGQTSMPSEGTTTPSEDTTEEIIFSENIEIPSGTPDTNMVTLDFLPEDLVADGSTPEEATAIINGTSITVYKSLDNGAEGITIPVDFGTEITLVTKYAFTLTDGSTLVFYRYDYTGENTALEEAAIGETSGYPFIYAESLSFGSVSELVDTTSGIKLSAILPENVQLSVSAQTLTEAGLDTEVFHVGSSALCYDVTLLLDSAEYQPASGVAVIFPASAVLASGLEVGDRYHAYHIHDGAVEILSSEEYTGGDLTVYLDNLSTIVITETEVAIDVTEDDEITQNYYFTDSDGKYVEYAAYINRDDIYIYDGFLAGDVGLQVTGALGVKIYLAQYIEYESGKAYYRYYYDVLETEANYSDEFDIKSLTYGFIPAEYVNWGCYDDITGITITGVVLNQYDLVVIPQYLTDFPEYVDTSFIDWHNYILQGYDISILNEDGTKWQPAEGETVMVTIPNAWDPEWGIYSQVDVYHVNDEGTEAIEKFSTTEDTVFRNEDGSIAFDASSFSTYLVSGGKTDTITITTKDGDTHTANQKGHIIYLATTGNALITINGVDSPSLPVRSDDTSNGKIVVASEGANQRITASEATPGDSCIFKWTWSSGGTEYTADVLVVVVDPDDTIYETYHSNVIHHIQLNVKQVAVVVDDSVVDTLTDVALGFTSGTKGELRRIEDHDSSVGYYYVYDYQVAANTFGKHEAFTTSITIRIDETYNYVDANGNPIDVSTLDFIISDVLLVAGNGSEQDQVTFIGTFPSGVYRADGTGEIQYLLSVNTMYYGDTEAYYGDNLAFSTNISYWDSANVCPGKGNNSTSNPGLSNSGGIDVAEFSMGYTIDDTTYYVVYSDLTKNIAGEVLNDTNLAGATKQFTYTIYRRLKTPDEGEDNSWEEFDSLSVIGDFTKDNNTDKSTTTVTLGTEAAKYDPVNLDKYEFMIVESGNNIPGYSCDVAYSTTGGIFKFDEVKSVKTAKVYTYSGKYVTTSFYQFTDGTYKVVTTKTSTDHEKTTTSTYETYFNSEKNHQSTTLTTTITKRNNTTTTTEDSSWKSHQDNMAEDVGEDAKSLNFDDLEPTDSNKTIGTIVYNAKLTCNNTYTKIDTRLHIGKVVNGAGAPTGEQFTVVVESAALVNGTAYTYTIGDSETEQTVTAANGSLSLNLTKDQTLKIKVPAGTYTIREIAGSTLGFTYDDTAYTRVITDAAGAAVTITNIFSADKTIGSLKVSKEVVTENINIQKPTGNERVDFNFSVVFENTGSVTSFSYSIYETSGAFVSNGTISTTGTITLKDGQYALFEGLKQGVTYKVTEVTDTSSDYELKSSSETTGTIVAEQQSLASFVNKYNVVTINYEVVGPDGCGTVGLGDTSDTGDSVSETIAIFTGVAQGATAAPTNSNIYKFVGWYQDKECNQPVPSGWVDEKNKIIPKKTNDLNVAATYYAKFEELDVTINYKVVGPDGCGTVGLGDTSNTGISVSETIAISTGNAQGSTAVATSDVYKFVGWFKDKGCTIPVDYDTTNNKFVPAKVDEIHVAATYYAKFEYNLTSLTIKKVGYSEYATIDPNQTFIFNVKGSDGVDLTVTIHGDDEITITGLTVGNTYTITEETDWSWRYDFASWAFVTDGDTDATGNTNGASVTLGATGNVITFSNTRTNDQWLDGDSYKVNIFNGTTESQE